MYSRKDQIAKVLLKKLDETEGPVCIFLHASIDGDCLGSACGLSEVLKNLGYETKVCIREKIQYKMSFLDVDEYVVNVEENPGIKPALAIAVDCAEGSRMGAAGKLFDACKNKMIIDHHRSVSLEGDEFWIVPEASSAAELVYYLSCSLAEITGKRREEVISRKAADLFMAGLVTDTGRFSYSNTRPETIKAASELMELGAQIAPIMYWFFDWKTKSELLISSEAASRARFDLDGKIATTVVTDEMFKEFNADREDIGEVVSRLRDVEGVCLAMVFREQADGSIRVNIRSADPFDASVFAERYNGGGHVRAAGCTVCDRDIYELRDEMVREAAKLF